MKYCLTVPNDFLKALMSGTILWKIGGGLLSLLHS